ncbi:MAG: AAA family ATPase [Pseudomonadota bacterium]|nr:AAA family ATPase [Pseudomonadota bacterium]
MPHDDDARTAEARTAALAARLRDAAIARGDSHVQLRHTHISWLLLAGEYAYKLKKPLNLGFLDFSTLAQRHTACLQELRINRRSAPQLYLNVLPITGSPQAPRIGPSSTPGGPVLDWVVHMRRFPEQALMAGMAARGELSGAHIDALAAHIAAFQAQAAIAPAHSPWGLPADLAALAQDNIQSLLSHFGRLRASKACEQLQKLEQWTRQQSQHLAPLMAARRAAGCVREGHGDLHLGNLLWLHGAPVLFDAIEFNPALRWIDTACDIAFLCMDLHAHGQSALAWRFLNAWLDHTGEHTALPRLPYDMVYRALVRAKVAALHTRQGHGADDDHAHDSTRYVHLAAQLAAPRTPWLALTHGVSGSGKSSQSQGLIEQHGLLRLRADVERKRLFGLPLHASSAHVPGGIYTEAASDQTFAHLLHLARQALQAGQPVLVDATFIRHARRAPFIALAQQLRVPWAILAFHAPENLLRERVRQRQQRGGDASEADEAVLQAQLAHIDPFTPQEQAHTLPLDTTCAVDWAAAWPRLRQTLGLTA